MKYNCFGAGRVRAGSSAETSYEWRQKTEFLKTIQRTYYKNFIYNIDKANTARIFRKNNMG